MDEWPKLFKFTCPKTDIPMAYVLTDADHADEIFTWFFTKWGPDVPYSVD